MSIPVFLTPWINTIMGIWFSMEYCYTGCWFDFLGTRIKVLKAKEVNISGNVGETLNNKLTIGCAENAIQILEIKKEGKNKISVDEFLKGNKFEKGLSLL